MILVTGGAGFIGSNLVDCLLSEGFKIRVLDNFSTGQKENINWLLEKFPKQLEFVEGTICDRDICKSVLRGIRYVSHHAAIPSVPRSVEYPIETNETNVVGTLTLLQEARNVDGLEKFVFASSSSAYGDIKGNEKIESLPVNPLSIYAAQKIMGEFYIKLYCDLYGLPTIALRYFNIFGPRQNPHSQYSAVIPLFIKAFLRNTPPIIYGDGLQSRDFTFVENVIFANRQAFACRKNGLIVNIGCGVETTLNELIRILQEIFKTNLEPTYTHSRLGDVKNSCANIEKAKELLGYRPLVNVREGLEKTVKWYRNNQKESQK